MKWLLAPSGRTLRVTVELGLDEAIDETGSFRPGYLTRLQALWDEVHREAVDAFQLITAEPERGVVRWFDEQKGYGFIRDAQGRELFVHWRGIAGEGFKSLAADDVVLFQRRAGRQSAEAFNVAVVQSEAGQ